MNTLAHKHRKSKRKGSSPRWECRYPYNFDKDFPRVEHLKNSISLFVEDLIRALSIETDTEDLERLVEPLHHFIDEFYKELRQRNSCSAVKDYASLCKRRESDLHDFIYLIIDGFDKTGDALNNLFVLKAKGSTKDGISLSDLRYIPSSFKGLILQGESSSKLDTHVVELTSNPRIYIYLYRYVLSMLNFLTRNGVGNLADQEVAYLFLVADSVGTIWRQINEAGEPAMITARKLYDTLTGDPGVQSPEFWDLFNAVVEDLDLNNRLGRHPKYVLEFRKAYFEWIDSGENTRQFTVSDYYCALRGSTSQFSTTIKDKSLIASLYETDFAKSDSKVAAFDSYIGYQSGYNEEFIVPTILDRRFVTMFVANPNKDDPRGIHIGDNAIQDRCSWLHYRTQNFLNRLDTDCMKRHEAGVQFLKRITSRNYRMMHHNDVINSDFTSATDNLNPTVQERVIGILYPECVVDFWHYVSTCEKWMHMPDGTWVKYQQTRGQPQGLRGSFDFFSLFHHIAMLMTMKKTGRENELASEFYRILGDDSVINTITPDPDEEVTEAYHWICTQSDLKFSDGKVFHSHYQDELPTYVSDFAKVTVRDGTMLSKVPLKLLATYASRIGGMGLNTVFWLNAKGCCRKDLLEYAIDRVSGDNLRKKWIIKSIIYSGKIEFLKGFENPSVFNEIPWEISSSALFVFGFKTVTTSMLNFLYSEKEAEEMILHPDLFDQAWKEMIPNKRIEDLLNRVTNPNHKFYKLMDENCTLVDALETLLCCSNLEATLASMVLFSKVGSRQILDLLTVKEDIQASTLPEGEFPMTLYDLGDRYNYYFSRIEQESRVSFNSSRRRSTDPTAIFERIDKSFDELFEGSSPVLDAWDDYLAAIQRSEL